jgi:hypothetical protein
MAYSDYEESVEAGQPVQLFLFRYGSDPLEYLAYTDHDEELTVSSITYAPVAVSREDIEADGTLDRASLKIRMDVGTDLAELFRVYPPSSVVTLVIAEGHIGDPDEQFLVTWAGRVVSASRDHSELLLTGEPVTTSMRRPGLRRQALEDGRDDGFLDRWSDGHAGERLERRAVGDRVGEVAWRDARVDRPGRLDRAAHNPARDGRHVHAVGNPAALGGERRDRRRARLQSLGLCGGRRRLPAAAQQHSQFRRLSLDPAQESNRCLQQLLLRI